jgi:signal transduction histidine kinase
VLAAGALAAIYFDPSQPVGGEQGYLLLIAYVVFALVSLAIASRSRSMGWQLSSHLVDICVITGVMYYTEGPTSPYFVLFSFLLFSATLQWDWLGAILTGTLLVLLIAALGLLAPVSPLDTDELDRLIMRAVYLLVASVLFAYVGAYLARTRRRLAQLAVWPHTNSASGSRPALQAPLAHAAHVLAARRALVLWEAGEEPYRYVALWNGTSCEYRDEPPDAFASIVAAPYASATFAFDATTGQTIDERGARQAGMPFEPSLIGQFGIQNAITAPFASARHSGRLFLLDLPDFDANDLSFAEIAAARIRDELDRHAREQDAGEAAKLDERARVARDLHDGILQTLTAARLQISNLEGGAPEKIRHVMHFIGDVLRREQQRLREFVEQTEGSNSIHASNGRHEPFAALADDLSRLWNCEVKLETRPPDLVLSAQLASGVRMMVLEAVANAARHGTADRIYVMIERQADLIELTVRDNGRGMLRKPDPAGGDADVPSPASLRTRAAELGGDIYLVNDSSGLSVQIRLPVA